MADVKTTQVVAEVELGPTLKTTQVVAEVELGGSVKTTQVVAEVELGDADAPLQPVSVSQFVLEVDVGTPPPDVEVQVSQFMIEVDVPTPPVANPPSVSQFMIEVEETGIDFGVQDTFSAAAYVLDPSSVRSYFSAGARVIGPSTVRSLFSASAYVFKEKVFTAQAAVRLPVPDTVGYPSFSGGIDIRLLDWDFTVLDTIDNYKRLEYFRAVNGQFYDGMGYYTIEGPESLMPSELFKTDCIVQVRRYAPGGTPVVVFEGLHRKTNTWFEDGIVHFGSSGPDLKHLAKRRIILPQTGQDLFSLSGPFTNSMRDIVRYNMESLAGATRQMPRLSVNPNNDYGLPINLNYRHTIVYDELVGLAQAGVGADWSIDLSGGQLVFDIHYPFRGWDKRTGNGAGNFELVWSIDRGNVVTPSFEEDRNDEVTVVYAGGPGIGADRYIIERTNIAYRDQDSPWNRIERFIDASNETSEAALKATSDAYLVENGMKRTFSLEVGSGMRTDYGTLWNLGDVCTGVFEPGGSFDMRIVGVREVHDRNSGVETLSPVFFMYPRLEDY